MNSERQTGHNMDSTYEKEEPQTRTANSSEMASGMRSMATIPRGSQELFAQQESKDLVFVEEQQ